MIGDWPLSVAFLPFCRESSIGQEITLTGHKLDSDSSAADDVLVLSGWLHRMALPILAMDAAGGLWTSLTLKKN